ncbi:MAG: helix-turn-helix domain-containing protein [Galbitalea sp.]
MRTRSAHPSASSVVPLDASRDSDILEAALDVLAEEGYDGMTIDMVAARAKAGKATLYRRWPSKTELVLDAVACMKTANIDYADLPDTGHAAGGPGRDDQGAEHQGQREEAQGHGRPRLAAHPQSRVGRRRQSGHHRAPCRAQPDVHAARDRPRRDSRRRRSRDPRAHQPIDDVVPGCSSCANR